MNTTDQKCAHKNCSCLAAPNSQYCSPACETGKGSESACGCGHPGCTGAREVAAYSDGRLYAVAVEKIAGLFLY